MSDILWFAFSTAVLYCFSLVGIEYARDKTKKVRVFLTSFIIVVFSIVNGWIINVNFKKIPVTSIEKEWCNYTAFCKEEHISWNELTFPEWLELKQSE